MEWLVTSFDLADHKWCGRKTDCPTAEWMKYGDEWGIIADLISVGIKWWQEMHCRGRTYHISNWALFFYYHHHYDYENFLLFHFFVVFFSSSSFPRHSFRGPFISFFFLFFLRCFCFSFLVWSRPRWVAQRKLSNEFS